MEGWGWNPDSGGLWVTAVGEVVASFLSAPQFEQQLGERYLIPYSRSRSVFASNDKRAGLGKKGEPDQEVGRASELRGAGEGGAGHGGGRHGLRKRRQAEEEETWKEMRGKACIPLPCEM